jgi:hypothetical protein
LEIQNVDSLNQAEQRRLQTRTSLLNLQVETGAAASFQTIPVEQQLSSQTTNVQAGRIQAILATDNLERSERIRLNEQLAQLYEQDAQKQIDLQIRLTASIREENNRRVENFKNFFSSVESASSDLLVAGLLKTQTKEQALKSLATSVVTSFVKETESMASKFAGRGLANMLGINIKEGEDTSVSNVLAKSLGSMLGITQPESKLDNAAVAQRMQQAGDAQKQPATSCFRPPARCTPKQPRHHIVPDAARSSALTSFEKLKLALRQQRHLSRRQQKPRKILMEFPEQ